MALTKVIVRALAVGIIGFSVPAALAQANFIFHQRTSTPIAPGKANYVDILDPGAGQSEVIRWKVQYNTFTNQARLYYTTDGSTPGGTFGTGSGTTQVITASYVDTFVDPTTQQLVDIIQATIPAQPANTTVKYIVSAWKVIGALTLPEYFADGGTCPTCNPTTNSNSATVFSYGSSAQMPAACPVAPLTTYTAPGFVCSINNLKFSNFLYSASSTPALDTVPANQVEVTPVTTVAHEGFQFNGAFTAASTSMTSQSGVISFDVDTEDASLTLQSGNLFFDGALTGTGAASVAGNYCVGGEFVGCPAANLVTTTVTPGNYTATAPTRVVATANHLGTSFTLSLASGANGAAYTSQVITTFASAIAPNFQKAFGTSPIPLGGSSTLTFILTNSQAASQALSGLAFTDVLPQGLRVANPNGLSNTCGGVATANAGGDAITLANGSLGAGGTCSIAVNVTGTTSGVKTNVTPDLTTNEWGVIYGNGATASLTVNGSTQGPDLTIVKTHNGPWGQGQQAAVYSITVTNSGNAATSGTVTVLDTLPAGLTALGVGGAGGPISGWSCLNNSPITCTRADPLAAGSSYPPILISVAVSPTAGPGVLTNTASVSGGGEVAGVQGNNTVTDPTVINAPATPGACPNSVPLTTYLAPGFSCTVNNLLFNGFQYSSAGLATANNIFVSVQVTPGNEGLSFSLETGIGGEGANSTMDGLFSFTATTADGSPTLNGVSLTADLNASNGGVADITEQLCRSGVLAGCASTNTGQLLFLPSSPGTGVSMLFVPSRSVTVSKDLSLASGLTGNASTAGFTNTFPNGALPAVLGITKNHAGNFFANETGTYTIVVSNLSSTPTSGTITVVDTVPTGLTVTAMLGAGWSCVVGTATCTTSAPIPPFSSAAPITVTVQVAANAPAQVTNSVTVSGGGATGSATANDPTNIVSGPDLTITKTHSGPIRQGDVGVDSYTLTVKNIGSAASSGVITVSDTFPAGITNLAIAPVANWSCGITVSTLTCTSSTSLGINGQQAFTVTFDIPPTSTGTLTNTATVSGGGDVNPGNNSATDTATITLESNLTVSKSHTGSFKQGDADDTYTITVTNTGGAATTGNWTLTDAVPTGLTATSIAPNTGCTVLPASVSCTLSSVLAPAGTAIFTLHVSVANNAPASVTNSATVAGGGEIFTTDDAASDVTSITQAADLSVTKTHSGPFQQGDTGVDSYNITVTNVGAASTSGTVTLNDPLPAGVTGTTFTAAAGWNCTLNAGVFNCTTSNAIATNTPQNFTVNVNIGPATTGTISNTATVSGGGEINLANDSSTDTVSIVLEPNLTVTKSHTAVFRQGDADDTYTITVTNSGGAATTGNWTMSDSIPTGLTFVSISPSTGCVTNANPIVCTSAAVLAPAGTSTFTLHVSVANNAPALVTNSVIVAGGGEIFTTDDTATDPTSIGQAPDLTVNKTHTGPFKQGDNGVDSYTITVTNVGSAPTSGAVTLNDALPAGVTGTTFVAASGWNCTLNTGVFNCTTSNAIAVNTPQTFTLNVNIPIASTGTISNTATVSGGGEINLANDSSTDTVTITLVPNLTVTKSHSATFRQGDADDTYTITVTNSGGAATSGNWTMRDTLPTGLAFVSISPSNGCVTNSNPIVCTSSAVLAANGGNTVFTLHVSVASNAPASVTNSVTVGGGGEVTTNDDTATDVTGISQVPNLQVSKTHTALFMPGDAADQYTITVTNVGGATTLEPWSITDTLPTGLSYVSITSTAPSTCNNNSGVVTCNTQNAFIAPGGTFVFTLTVSVAQNAPASVTNTVTVAGGGEVITNDDTATDVTQIGVPSDLVVTKYHSATFHPFDNGDTFVITVVNIGAGPTRGLVTLTDTLPIEMTPVSISGAGWTCPPVPTSPITCTRSDSLQPTASYPPLVLTVNVAGRMSLTLINTATVAGGGELNTSNDTATDDGLLPPDGPDLTITKVHNGTFNLGDIGHTYTITVTNNGVHATLGTVSVVDTLPTGLTATAISGTGWTCTLGSLTCVRTDVLGIGASYPPITVTVNVANNAPASVTNTAVVGGGGEPNLANDTATDTTTVGPSVTVTVQTSVAGLGITVDGQNFTSPHNFVWQVGTVHTIGTTSPQQVGGTGPSYMFIDWSDFLSITHNVTANAATTSYTAMFIPTGR